MSELALWYLIFCGLVATFAFILVTEKKRKPYFLYFLFGMLFGFYFDTVSFKSGYYSYAAIFPITIFGLPASMTIAEGLSVAITIYLFEKLKSLKN